MWPRSLSTACLLLFSWWHTRTRSSGLGIHSFKKKESTINCSNNNSKFAKQISTVKRNEKVFRNGFRLRKGRVDQEHFHLLAKFLRWSWLASMEQWQDRIWICIREYSNQIERTPMDAQWREHFSWATNTPTTLQSLSYIEKDMKSEFLVYLQGKTSINIIFKILAYKKRGWVCSKKFTEELFLWSINN